MAAVPMRTPLVWNGERETETARRAVEIARGLFPAGAGAPPAAVGEAGAAP